MALNIAGSRWRRGPACQRGWVEVNREWRSGPVAASDRDRRPERSTTGAAQRRPARAGAGGHRAVGELIPDFKGKMPLVLPVAARGDASPRGCEDECVQAHQQPLHAGEVWGNLTGGGRPRPGSGHLPIAAIAARPVASDGTVFNHSTVCSKRAYRKRSSCVAVSSGVIMVQRQLIAIEGGELRQVFCQVRRNRT